MNKNQQQELIEKTILTSDLLNGGQLNAEQQDRFVVFVKQFQVMMNEVRFERMPQPRMDIDKLHMGEPITEAASEDTTSSNEGKPKFNKISLSVSKVRSQWSIVLRYATRID